MVTSISLTTKASQNCETCCHEIIVGCHEVINAADNTIESLKLERQIQKDLLDIKDGRIKELEVWYRDPKYVLPLGILIGIVVRK